MCRLIWACVDCRYDNGTSSTLHNRWAAQCENVSSGICLRPTTESGSITDCKMESKGLDDNLHMCRMI